MIAYHHRKNKNYKSERNEVYDWNKNKLDGKYKKVLSDKELYDQNGNKLSGVYRKLETDIPGIEAYDKNGLRIDDLLINIVTCLQQTPLTDHKRI